MQAENTVQSRGQCRGVGMDECNVMKAVGGTNKGGPLIPRLRRCKGALYVLRALEGASTPRKLLGVVGTSKTAPARPRCNRQLRPEAATLGKYG
jgi:hypothetical protein